MKKLYDNGMINLDSNTGNITVDKETMKMQLIDPQLKTADEYWEAEHYIHGPHSWPRINKCLYRYYLR